MHLIFAVARQRLLPGLRAHVVQLGRFPLDAGLLALQLLQPGVDGPRELGVLGLVDDARGVIGVHAQPQVAVVLDAPLHRLQAAGELGAPVVAVRLGAPHGAIAVDRREGVPVHPTRVTD